ncbi:MAG: hypothetical protein ACLQU3_09290 [Limisphaerales bacterium]
MIQTYHRRVILQPALALFLQELPPLQHLPGFARPGATQTLAAYALPYDEKSEPILLAKYQFSKSKLRDAYYSGNRKHDQVFF